MNLIGEVRLDDLLIVLLFFMFLMMDDKQDFLINVLKSTPVIYLTLFVIFSLFSTFYNSLIIDRIDLFQGMLFSIRHFEYLAFIVLGYFLAFYNVKLSSILRTYLVYVFVLVMLQANGIIDPVSGFTADRAIGNTGGPWELAAVAAFLMFYFFDRKDWVFFILSFLILILTESRITTLAVIAVLIVPFIKNWPLKFISISVFTVLLFLIYALTNQISEKSNFSDGDLQLSVLDRVEQVFSNDTLSAIEDLISNAQTVQTQDEYFALTYGQGLQRTLQKEGDSSALVRFSRWAILIPTTLSNVDSSILGLGPSFAGKAVDGNYTRLLIETGLVGVLLYILFLLSLFFLLREHFLANYIAVLSLTALFIDVFTTYKAMMLLWVFIGIVLYKKSNKNIQVS